MVLKLIRWYSLPDCSFENDVNMYGTQAIEFLKNTLMQFENDVNMYGTQALFCGGVTTTQFENEVNMYGTQAAVRKFVYAISLRMM